MKKLVLLLGLGILVLGNLAAQTDSTANKADIKFDKTDYELGKIPMGPNTFEFVFTNTGKEPLVLSNVAPGCGCTKADWPKEPIAKGKKGVIKTTYNASAPGTFTKTITVYSNAKTPVVTLTFKAIVEEKSTAEAAKDQSKK